MDSQYRCKIRRGTALVGGNASIKRDEVNKERENESVLQVPGEERWGPSNNDEKKIANAVMNRLKNIKESKAEGTQASALLKMIRYITWAVEISKVDEGTEKAEKTAKATEKVIRHLQAVSLSTADSMPVIL